MRNLKTVTLLLASMTMLSACNGMKVPQMDDKQMLQSQDGGFAAASGSSSSIAMAEPSTLGLNCGDDLECLKNSLTLANQVIDQLGTKLAELLGGKVQEDETFDLTNETVPIAARFWSDAGPYMSLSDAPGRPNIHSAARNYCFSKGYFDAVASLTRGCTQEKCIQRVYAGLNVRAKVQPLITDVSYKPQLLVSVTCTNRKDSEQIPRARRAYTFPGIAPTYIGDEYVYTAAQLMGQGEWDIPTSGISSVSNEIVLESARSFCRKEGYADAIHSSHITASNPIWVQYFPKSLPGVPVNGSIIKRPRGTPFLSSVICGD